MDSLTFSLCGGAITRRGPLVKPPATAKFAAADIRNSPRHPAGTKLGVAVFSILPSRARYVAQSILGANDGQRPKGVIVSVRYAAYAFVDLARRQVCWAHLVRDFKRISDRCGKPGRVGRTLLGAAYLLFRYRTQSRPAEVYARLQKRVRRALMQGSQSACA